MYLYINIYELHTNITLYFNELIYIIRCLILAGTNTHKSECTKKVSARNLFEISLNQTEIRLYLPFPN